MEDKQPPKLSLCKICHYNLGNDVTKLCATCDPNHIWWKKKDQTEEIVEKIKKLKF